MTYLDGLQAAQTACHVVRGRLLKDRREALAEGDTQAQVLATSGALAVWLCIEEIHTLIAKTPP